VTFITGLLKQDLGPIVVASALWLIQDVELPDPWGRVGQVGLGALLGLYIVVQVLERLLPLIKPNAQVKTKGNPADSIKFKTDLINYLAQMKHLHAMVKELHDLHDVRGADGMPVWWQPVGHLTQLTRAIEDVRQELRDLHRAVDELKRDTPT
jgi:hypothetical protein